MGADAEIDASGGAVAPIDYERMIFKTRIGEIDRQENFVRIVAVSQTGVNDRNAVGNRGGAVSLRRAAVGTVNDHGNGIRAFPGKSDRISPRNGRSRPAWSAVSYLRHRHSADRLRGE